MHLNNGLDIPPRNRDILETSILEILRTHNASMWLAGPTKGERNYVDSLGAQPLTGVNQLVGYVDDQLGMNEAENFVVNSEMVGASPGVLPTGWFNGGSANVVTSCVGAGADEFGNYVDIRYAGTTLGAIEYPSVGMHPAVTAPAASEGDLISTQAYLQIMTTQGVGWLCYPATVFRNAAGAYVMDAGAGGQIGSDVRTLARTAIVGVGATIARVASNVSLVCPASTVVDVVVRIWQPHQKKGGYPASYTPTYGTAVIRTENLIHVSQATTGFKPVLTGGATNHVRKGLDTTDGTYWSTSAGVTKESFRTVDDLGTVAVLRNIDTVAQHSIRIYNTTTAFPENIPVELVMHVRYISGDPIIGFQFKNNAGGFGSILTFNAMTGVIVTGTAAGISLRVEKAVEGFWRCTFSADSSGAGAGVANLICYFNSGATVLGSTEDMIEVGGGMMLTGELPYYGPLIPSGATGLTYSDTVPYAWKFDGVDDRLVVAKPTIPDGAVSHFRIIALKMPSAAPGTNQVAVSGASTVASVRLAHLTLLSGGFNIDGRWVNGAGTTAIPANHTRAANEKLVVRMSHVAGTYILASKGDIGAAQNTSITPAALGAYTATGERIGCSYATGVENTFSSWVIYGIISGNGNPTAGELLAMENFLAGHAGFTPLP